MSDWEKKFDKQFVDENPWEEGGGETKFVAIGNIRHFIRETIKAELVSLLEEIENVETPPYPVEETFNMELNRMNHVMQGGARLGFHDSKTTITALIKAKIAKE